MAAEHRQPDAWIDNQGQSICYPCEEIVYFDDTGWSCGCDSEDWTDETNVEE